jgi:hypothetical protein
MLSHGLVLSGTQGDFREERLRVKKISVKWRQGCQLFLLLIVNVWV